MQRAIELATGLVERITRLRAAVLRNEDRPAADAIAIQLNAMKQDVEELVQAMQSYQALVFTDNVIVEPFVEQSPEKVDE